MKVSICHQESFTPLGLVPREYDKTHPKNPTIRREAKINRIIADPKKIVKGAIAENKDMLPMFRIILPIFLPIFLPMFLPRSI